MPAKPPNIVFFLADDLGYADVSIYGRPDMTTPNIDRIGHEGIRFLQGYANSAVCSASRIALKKVGYQTTLLGKWHLGTLPDHDPLKSGYDHFFGFRDGALDYYNHVGPDHRHDLWDGDAEVHEAGYMTDLIGDRAVQEVNAYAKTGKPFFLDVHFNAPHWPWEAVGDQAEAERIKKASLFDFDGGSQKTYRDMILRMDMQIGRVLKALDDNHLAQNTIVIFTSDNGGERFADKWPFTGMKEDLLEGGLRIPVLLRWPARVKAGSVSQQIMIHMDWLPTLLAAAGGAPDPASPSDGMDITPWLTRNAAPVSRKLFWRYKANAQRAARDGDWKILKINENTFLFNVVDDPLERANLRERHSDIFDRMAREWNAWDSQMLPEVRESFTDAFTAAELADHIGAKPVVMDDIDSGTSWPRDPVPAPGAKK